MICCEYSRSGWFLVVHFNTQLHTHLSSQSFTKMLTHTQMDGGDTTECVTRQRGDETNGVKRGLLLWWMDKWNHLLRYWSSACLLHIHIHSCIMQDHLCLLQIEHHICSSWKLQSLANHKPVGGCSVLLITTQLVCSGACRISST